jgi:hypothetical protein
MSHLTPAEMLDLVEGSQPEAAAGRDSAAEHLAACAECRREFEEARRILSAVATSEMAEPPPFFWDQLSAQVRARIDAEGARRTLIPGGGWLAAPWRAAAVGAAAALLILIAVMTTQRSAVPARGAAPLATAPDERAAELAPGDPDAASLRLLGGLAADLSWDEVSEAGLMMDRGSVDEALAELTPEERSAVERLLQEALSPSSSAGQSS